MGGKLLRPALALALALALGLPGAAEAEAGTGGKRSAGRWGLWEARSYPGGGRGPPLPYSPLYEVEPEVEVYYPLYPPYYPVYPYYPEPYAYSYYRQRDEGDGGEEERGGTGEEEERGLGGYGGYGGVYGGYGGYGYGLGPYRRDPEAETNAVFLHNLLLAQMYERLGGGENPPPLPPHPLPLSLYGEPVVGLEPPERTETPEPEDRAANDRRNKHEDIFSEQQSRPTVGEARRRSSTSRYPGNRWERKREGKREGAETETGVETGVAAKRPPTVYDDIKKLLRLQDRLQEREAEKSRGPLRKRSFIPSEDSLVEELGSLKKAD